MGSEWQCHQSQSSSLQGFLSNMTVKTIYCPPPCSFQSSRTLRIKYVYTYLLLATDHWCISYDVSLRDQCSVVFCGFYPVDTVVPRVNFSPVFLLRVIQLIFHCRESLKNYHFLFYSQKMWISCKDLLKCVNRNGSTVVPVGYVLKTPRDKWKSFLKF